jgi:3-oxoadipate enol-lactonase
VSTVVLCGSLGASAQIWEPQLAALSGHSVRIIEHPGHGGAPLEPVGDVAGLARRVLRDVPATRFSFVGVSLGGAVGMRIALDEPERIDRLVLCCTSARFGAPEPWRERAATVRAGGMETVADAHLERWFTPAFADVRPYREMILSTEPEGYARCCEALAAWDVGDELWRIGAPTLVVSGADDPATPPEHGEQIAAAIPGARHEVLANARHLANVERAGEFNRLLLGQLA